MHIVFTTVERGSRRVKPILVNYYNPLPEDYTPEDLIPLSTVKNRCFKLLNENMKLCKEAADQLNAMLIAAGDAGYSDYFVRSAYRNRSDQEASYKKLGDGSANRPGCSEHETGLAVDLGSKSIIDEAGETPLDWISQNCHKYGYILRYEDNKKEITGIKYEPWHFRYVGKDIAEYMYEHDLCLEEYFEEKYNTPTRILKINNQESETEKKLWDFFMDKLKNPYGVAGLLGNLYAESNYRTNVLQYTYHSIIGLGSAEYTEAIDNGEYTNFMKDCAGYGLAQWTYSPRKEGLLNYARSKNVSISDLNMQMEYLWIELTTEYSDVLKVLVNAPDVRTASDAVLTDFENPADQSKNVKIKRASFGNRALYRFVDKSFLEHQLSLYSLWREDISLLLINMDTGEIIYDKNADIVRPIGSITKLMTAYVLWKNALSDRKHLSDTITIDNEAALISSNPQYSCMEQFKAGEEYTAEYLLKFSLIASGCASTIALAKHYFGSTENLVQIMNKEAKEMGLSAHFEDVIGVNPYSTASARDISIICQELVRKYPFILKITSQKRVVRGTTSFKNTSRLIRENWIQGLDGFKTGTSPDAGKCYVGTAKRNGHRVLSIVLNAQEENERINTTLALLEFGLSKANETN